MLTEPAPKPNACGGFDYEPLFPRVRRPSRYIGGEWNSLPKPEPFRRGAVSVCLCFPDLYETGFANTGIEILYQIVNRREDAYAERAYSADTDMADALRARGLPLFSLESRQPIGGFDIVGFGLPYELCYNNVLEMLDLAQIPLRSNARTEAHPLVIAGGPCAVNPEPMAEFLDAVVIGDGEDILGDIVAAVGEYKRGGKRDRQELLLRLAAIEGLYVPSLYEVAYRPDQTVASVRPKLPGVPERVAYRRASLDPVEGGFSFPVAPVVPFVQTVHDRLNVEIQRGCPWRCRFCQAGFSYRPYRERSMQELIRVVELGLRNTGYDAVTLAGLSAADHSEIVPLLQALAGKFFPQRVAIGLPSTRADRFTLALADILASVRRQSLTFAPEGGSERMRRVLRKELQESEVRATLSTAHRHGWKSLKLYFMYGLPTEAREDLDGIVRLVRDSRKENPGLSFTLTLSPFVPKPHTPYQWAAQDRIEALREKLAYLKKNLPAQVRAHGLEQIVVEGVLARGDRRCAALIETAWRNGAKFDEWGERFRFEIWQKAFESCGLSPEHYSHRERGADEVFPWDHLQGGPEKRALRNDYETALRQAAEPLPEKPHLKERPEVAAPMRFQTPPSRTVQRIRFRLARRGSVRFLSHLEQIEMIRRALRRAAFPLAFTSGFHPQMKAAFGPAISVGYESECEYFDLDLEQRMDLEAARRGLAEQLPAGFTLLSAARVPLFFPSLESLVNRVRYEIEVPPGCARGAEDGAEGLLRHLKDPGRVYEKVRHRAQSLRIPLAPLVISAGWEGTEQGGARVSLTLKFGPGKIVKPEAVLGTYLGLPPESVPELRVNRTSFFVEKPDGATIEL